MMTSKLFLLLGLSLAVSLLIASEVSARELAETTAHASSSEATGAEKTKEHIDGYGHGGQYGGGGGQYGGGGGHYGGGGGHYGGGGGQYGGGGGHYGGGGGHYGGGGGHCRYGCCGGYHGGCQRCCGYKGEAAEIAAAAAEP